MAITPEEILNRATWEADSSGDSTPPTETDLCDWMIDSGYRYVSEEPIVHLLSVTTLESTGDRMLFVQLHPLDETGKPSNGMRGAILLGVAGIHRVFKARADEYKAKGETAPEHPIVTLVRDWLHRPRPVEPYKPTQRGSLPSFHRVTQETGKALSLIKINGGISEDPPQLTLPGAPAITDHCPSWLLRWFDATGGRIGRQGRSAPWPLRLAIGAMLHLGIADRNGIYRRITLPTQDVIRWLHPHGWTHRARDWPKFPAALDAIGQLPRVYFSGIGGVQVITPSVIPLNQDDPWVVFTLIIPTQAAHGARIDWPRLCAYGVESAMLYRAYLAAMAHLDLSARRGHPVTRLIGEKAIDATTGKPRRMKGGRIVRTGKRIPNDLERYVPTMNEKGLTALTGKNPDERYNRHRARVAFERLDDDGVIDLRRNGHGGGWQIFGPI